MQQRRPAAVAPAAVSVATAGLLRIVDGPTADSERHVRGGDRPHARRALLETGFSNTPCGDTIHNFPSLVRHVSAAHMHTSRALQFSKDGSYGTPYLSPSSPV